MKTRKSDLSNAVRKLRKSQGPPGRPWSQDRLARELGITKTSVAAWEQGLSEPSPASCAQLAALCKGKLAAFFARQGGFRLTSEPNVLRVTSRTRIEDDQRSHWHSTLDEVLESRDEELIQALTRTLDIFQRYLRLRPRTLGHERLRPEAS